MTSLVVQRSVSYNGRTCVCLSFCFNLLCPSFSDHSSETSNLVVHRAIHDPTTSCATSSITIRHASSAAINAIAPLSVKTFSFVISRDTLCAERLSADGPTVTRMTTTRTMTTQPLLPRRPTKSRVLRTSGASLQLQIVTAAHAMIVSVQVWHPTKQVKTTTTRMMTATTRLNMTTITKTLAYRVLVPNPCRHSQPDSPTHSIFHLLRGQPWLLHLGLPPLPCPLRRVRTDHTQPLLRDIARLEASRLPIQSVRPFILIRAILLLRLPQPICRLAPIVMTQYGATKSRITASGTNRSLEQTQSPPVLASTLPSRGCRHQPMRCRTNPVQVATHLLHQLHI